MTSGEFRGAGHSLQDMEADEDGLQTGQSSLKEQSHKNQGQHKFENKSLTHTTTSKKSPPKQSQSKLKSILRTIVPMSVQPSRTQIEKTPPNQPSAAKRLPLRAEWSYEKLLKENPPIFKNSNKRYLFEKVMGGVTGILTNPYTPKDLQVLYARYKTDDVVFPERIHNPKHFIQTRVQVEADVYSYDKVDVPQRDSKKLSKHSNMEEKSFSQTCVSDQYEFHVNFADANLFGFYSGSLLAQDELQVMEHPILACIREKLLVMKRQSPAYKPSCAGGAVVVINAMRHMRFELNTLGKVYGNKFARTSRDKLKKYCTGLNTKENPPQTNNIIAMACRSGWNKRYKIEEIEDIFMKAYTGFYAAKKEAENHYQRVTRDREAKPAVVIHTGNWGCGAFGGNVTLHSLLQIVAASCAQVDFLRYHSFDAWSKEDVREGCTVLDKRVFRGKESLTYVEFCEAIHGLNYKWGVPNGT